MISKFKALPKGIQRSIIVGVFIIPYIAGIIFVALYIQNPETFAWFFIGLIIFTPLYCILAFAGIWIYEGFKNDK